MGFSIRVVLVLLSLFSLVKAYPQELNIRPYLGAGGGHMLLVGSFNGADYFQTDEDILLVPKISPAFGYGGAAGFGVGNGAFEISYYRYESDYSTMNAEYTGKCVTHLIRYLGITMYFEDYSKGRINPYLDFESSVVLTKCDKIAYPLGRSNDPSPANYSGIVFGIGGGCRAWLTNGFALDLRVLPEYYMGTDIKVEDRDRYEIKKFGNFLLHTTLSLKYYFKGNSF